jgi:hypothetical protein
MSFGKGGGTTYQTATMTPEQQAQIKAQTDFFTGTVGPAYQQAVGGATNLYNSSATGVQNAAQNLAGTAMQGQNALGSTGESALRTGISGLENLFTPEYEQQQLNAVLQPAQAQYQQNLANQGAQFGGAGQLGSARQALAQTQLAGANQASQQQAAAGVEQNIAGQRLAAGQSLAGLGQGGIGQAIGAAQQGVTAAMTPQQLYQQYASVLFGTPAASYNPNFAGTQGYSKTSDSYSMGIGGANGSSGFGIKM